MRGYAKGVKRKVILSTPAAATFFAAIQPHVILQVLPVDLWPLQKGFLPERLQ